MKPYPLPTYVAFGKKIWSFEKAEFRVFLAARSRGVTTDEGDPNRTGNPLKATISQSPSAQELRGGFPKNTDGRPRFKMDRWKPEHYRKCLEALDGGSLPEFGI